MKTEYQTPKTVAEIASVFLLLTPMRDPMIRPRLAFWIERFGSKLMLELTPDDIEAALIELEAVPGKKAAPNNDLQLLRLRCIVHPAISSIVLFFVGLVSAVLRRNSPIFTSPS